MSRRDLTEAEIRNVRRFARDLTDKVVKDQIERLCGEVMELRQRESDSRHLHGLEGEY